MFQWPAPGTDVHFDIVRLPRPPIFESDGGEIAFADAKSTIFGPGTVVATTADVSGKLTTGIQEFVDAVNNHASIPGRLIPADEFGRVTPVIPSTPEWTGDGGHKDGHSFSTDTAGQTLSFSLAILTITFGTGETAHTREIFRGPRLKWVVQNSPFGEDGFRLDRLEGRALGRRTTIRDLQTGEDAETNAIAVVYDGTPHSGIDSNALWLACSFLAGQSLAPAILETYNASGALLSRTFRPGYFTSAPPNPPFHVHYARIQPEWLELVVDGIAKKLHEGFPIDVVIAHAQDATEGSMERCMQSYLLAIHAASEAWTRADGLKTIYPWEQWNTAVTTMTEAAVGSVDFLNDEMKEIVRKKLGDANNTGTNVRLRAFCAAMGVDYSGADKKAVDLRNVLFHDGYLQRRFTDLSLEKRQERYHQLLRLRDFVYRVIFSLLEFPHPFWSALNPYQAIVARNISASTTDDFQSSPASTKTPK